MSYQNSAACQIVATHCACCGKPLVDAKSVELGIGPVCRKKYGFDIDVPNAVRKEANSIVYALAVAVSTALVTLQTLELVTALALLGFQKIADIFTFRCIDITIEVVNNEADGERYLVRAPYNPDFNHDSWIKGRYGVKVVPSLAPEGTKKKQFHWSFPKNEIARKRIWNALQRHHAGSIAMGPNGPFEIKG